MQVTSPFIRFAAEPPKPRISLDQLKQATSQPVEPQKPSDKPLKEGFEELAKKYPQTTVEGLEARYKSMKETLEKLAGVFETDDQILARMERELQPVDPDAWKRYTQAIGEGG